MSKIKHHFNKVMDFSLPMLIVCFVVGMIFTSCSAKAEIRTNIVDVLKDNRMSTKECLVYNLYQESRSESDMANIMVLNSVFNRVNSKHYPDTPCEVIKQRSQYSWTNDSKSDKLYNIEQVVRLEKIVDKYLLNKELFLSLSEQVDHYHKVTITPKWATSERMIYIGTLDLHKFYRRK